MLYCAIPQYVRGWELESHFKIPAYGWLMKRFGNVPVPDVRRPSDLKRMWRLTQDAIDGGRSQRRNALGEWLTSHNIFQFAVAEFARIPIFVQA